MRRFSPKIVALLASALFFALAKPVEAEEATATFALVIGVNRGVDRELPELRYADDDAARYQELFALLGTRTKVLTRLDKNSRRLHSRVAAEAALPRRAELERAVARIAADIKAAKRRKIRTEFYLVYAGHGNVQGGEAYVLLEDDRLSGKRLADLVARVNADQSHLVIDACHSGLLAMSRGPGGKRRPVSGFSRIGALLSDERVGLLLSSSSGRESHEWEAFQAGVFSHEVRSGLYGAADADRDGFVSYREIASFVDRANSAIPNERYRPDVYARAPSRSERLVDIHRALDRRVEVRAERGAHYLIENSLGVRLADFHPSADHEMRIARPSDGRLYLRRVTGTEREYEVPSDSDVVRLAELEEAEPRVAMRGAAHESFNLLFSAPFDDDIVRGYQFRPLVPRDEPADEPVAREETSWRRPTATVAFGIGAAALAVGAAFSLSAYSLHSDGDSRMSQASVDERNRKIEKRQTASYVAFGVAGAAAATGLAVLFWPDSRSAHSVSAAATPNAIGLGYAVRY